MCTLFCEIPSKSKKGKACNMLEPKFMGMASNNSSCSQNFEKWAWRVFLFLFIYFFLSDSGRNRPIRAETDRHRPKWTEIRVKKKSEKIRQNSPF